MSIGTVGEINVRIGGDNDPLKRQLKESEALVGKFDDKMMALKGAFAGIVAGVGAQQVISFLSDSVKMAGEAEQAFVKLQSVLKATGNAAGYTADELKSYAGSLQAATTFDDDGITNMMAVLATFRNISGETFREATSLALDMSQVLGSDLQSSAIQLGKALNEPLQGVSALSRVGIQFTQAQKDVIKSLVETGRVAEAQRIILDEVAGQMGGAATAAAKTHAGQLKQLQNEYGDLREEIGNTVNSIGDQIGVFDDLRATIRGLNKALAEDGNGIVVTMSAIGKSIGFVATMIPGLNNALSAYQTQLSRYKAQESADAMGKSFGNLGGNGGAVKMFGAADLGVSRSVIPQTKLAGGSGGGGTSRADEVEALRDSLKTELELEQERYDKGMELAAGDAELREALATDHAEKMREISGVTAWEEDLAALQNKFKTETELEQERYDAQLEQLAVFLENKAITQEEYQAKEAEALAAHEQMLTAITEEEAKKRAEAEKWAQDQIRNMRTSAVNSAVGLLNVFAGKSKAAAIAAVLLNKGLMAAQTIQNTAAATMKAMAIDPTGVLAARVQVMGGIQLGLIAATGVAEIASGGKSSSGTSGSSYGTSSYSSSGASSGSSVSTSRSITVYGLDVNSIYSGDQMLKALNEALADGGTLYIR